MYGWNLVVVSEAKHVPCPEWERKRPKADCIGGDPVQFHVSHTSRKIERWRLGSSIGEPLNWDYWTIDMSASLNSRLFTSTVGRSMLDEMPWTPGVMKFQSVLLWPPALGSIFGDSSRALRLFSSLYFFVLIRKVCSISGSSSYANGLHIKGKITLQAQHQHYQSNQRWNEK